MFKQAIVKAMTERPQDREPPARKLIESFGGRMHHYYFMLGEYDGLAIVEFPDNASATATSMRASTSGAELCGNLGDGLIRRRSALACR
jgi:uncharacterized protein with GYD domain